MPKLVELAKGNLAFAVGATVLLMVVTVGYLPIVLPLLLAGVTIDPWEIARSLILLMLLPLAAGLTVKAYYGDTALRVRPVLDWISNVSLILLALLISAANFDKVLDVFFVAGYRAAQHRRRTGRRESELQRSKSCRHGDCSRDCRIDYPHAVFSRHSQSLSQHRIQGCL